VGTLDVALQKLTGQAGPVDREAEAALYVRILRQRFENPERILDQAGTWDSADRVAVSG